MCLDHLASESPDEWSLTQAGAVGILVAANENLRSMVVLQVLGSFIAVMAAVMASSKPLPFSSTLSPERFSYRDKEPKLHHGMQNHFTHVNCSAAGWLCEPCIIHGRRLKMLKT